MPIITVINKKLPLHLKSHIPKAPTPSTYQQTTQNWRVVSSKIPHQKKRKRKKRIQLSTHHKICQSCLHLLQVAALGSPAGNFLLSSPDVAQDVEATQQVLCLCLVASGSFADCLQALIHQVHVRAMQHFPFKATGTLGLLEELPPGLQIFEEVLHDMVEEERLIDERFIPQINTWVLFTKYHQTTHTYAKC